jgi:hypothetical protein
MCVIYLCLIIFLVVDDILIDSETLSWWLTLWILRLSQLSLLKVFIEVGCVWLENLNDEKNT